MSTSYLGRAWRITITPQDAGEEEWTLSQNTFGTEALRCTFQIEQAPIATYWIADIKVYNFLPSAQRVIRAGDVVSVTAGYLAPGSGLIFKGDVFQPLWERANGTDNTLTLHCLVQLVKDQNGDVSTTIPAGSTPADCVRWIAAAANPQIQIEQIDSSLEGGPKLPRGYAYSGPASKYFAEIAAATGLNFWNSWNGINIKPLAPSYDTPDVIYSPPYAATSRKSGQGAAGSVTKYTLIGTPQQTNEGVVFRLLLDPDLKLGQLAQLDSVELKKIAIVPGQKLFIDPDGIYVVAGLTQIGDTRGNDWYTEVLAVTRPLSKFYAVMAR